MQKNLLPPPWAPRFGAKTTEQLFNIGAHKPGQLGVVFYDKRWKERTVVELKTVCLHVCKRHKRRCDFIEPPQEAGWGETCRVWGAYRGTKVIMNSFPSSPQMCRSELHSACWFLSAPLCRFSQGALRGFIHPGLDQTEVPGRHLVSRKVLHTVTW